MTSGLGGQGGVRENVTIMDDQRGGVCEIGRHYILLRQRQLHSKTTVFTVLKIKLISEVQLSDNDADEE